MGNEYDELAEVLHLLAPEELAAAERLLTPTVADVLRSLPGPVFDSLVSAYEQLPDGATPPAEDRRELRELLADDVLDLIEDTATREALRTARQKGFWNPTP